MGGGVGPGFSCLLHCGHFTGGNAGINNNGVQKYDRWAPQRRMDNIFTNGEIQSLECVA